MYTHIYLKQKKTKTQIQNTISTNIKRGKLRNKLVIYKHKKNKKKPLKQNICIDSPLHQPKPEINTKAERIS